MDCYTKRITVTCWTFLLSPLLAECPYSCEKLIWCILPTLSLLLWLLEEVCWYWEKAWQYTSCRRGKYIHFFWTHIFVFFFFFYVFTVCAVLSNQIFGWSPAVLAKRQRESHFVEYSKLVPAIDRLVCVWYLKVYRRGLQAIPLSVDLWLHYLTFIKENSDPSDPETEGRIRAWVKVFIAVFTSSLCYVTITYVTIETLYS